MLEVKILHDLLQRWGATIKMRFPLLIVAAIFLIVGLWLLSQYVLSRSKAVRRLRRSAATRPYLKDRGAGLEPGGLSAAAASRFAARRMCTASRNGLGVN